MEIDASDEMSTTQAVRAMLLLMPRLVGRAKRLPIPGALRGLDLAPRHLALLAYLQYDGPLTVNELASRLEVAPTTVSLMVGDLSRHGVLTRQEDDADRRRRIVAIAPEFAAPIGEWLAGSASAWTEVLAALSAEQRATIVATMCAYEAALERHAHDSPAPPPAEQRASAPGEPVQHGLSAAGDLQGLKSRDPGLPDAPATLPCRRPHPPRHFNFHRAAARR